MRSRIAAALAAAVAAAGAIGAALLAKRRRDASKAEPDRAVPEGAESPEVAEMAPPVVNPDLASDPPAGPSAPAASGPADPGDDLTAIRGLGKVKAARLAEAGVTSYAQIAAWTDDDIAAIGLSIGTSPGQIKREDWVGQARALLGD